MTRFIFVLFISSFGLACSSEAGRCPKNGNAEQQSPGITAGDDWETPNAADPNGDPCAKPVAPKEGTVETKDVYLHNPRGSNN